VTLARATSGCELSRSILAMTSWTVLTSVSLPSAVTGTAGRRSRRAPPLGLAVHFSQPVAAHLRGLLVTRAGLFRYPVIKNIWYASSASSTSPYRRS